MLNEYGDPDTVQFRAESWEENHKNVQDAMTQDYRLKALYRAFLGPAKSI